VLGYLAAGLLMEPLGFDVVDDPQALLHLAEIGVVMLLFVIGLELQPSRLRAFRKLVFGLGMSQVLVTSAVIAGAGMAFGLGWRTAVVVGLALSLSSTAMVLQLLSERGEMLTHQGRAAFGTLLFQDIAVIPILAILPILAPAREAGPASEMLMQVGLAVFTIVAFIFAGRLLLRHVLRAVAQSGIQEIFTAVTLLLVLASGLLFEAVGLSMGLGAFLAGLLVADSEYRHQLETDIAPFKGLLLGLFFIAIGMTVDVSQALSEWELVLGLAAALVATKAAIVFALARFFVDTASRRRAVAALLAQGGEFAFVIFTTALAEGVLEPALVDLMVIVVTVSMVTTPFVLMLNDWLSTLGKSDQEARPFDALPDGGSRVVIAGFGRFGQMIGRLLVAQNIPFTALESSPSQVDFVRRFGGEVYYGDPRRLDLLRTAHVGDADVFVIAIDDPESSLELARTLSKAYPALPLYARATSRTHALALMDLGVKIVHRELLPASIEMGAEVLKAVGFEAGAATRAAQLFREHDHATLEQQLAIYEDTEAMIAHQRDAARELQFLFESDRASADTQDVD
jgi:monovalent cation:proton antiporter-2 (CPA2) family protein